MPRSRAVGEVGGPRTEADAVALERFDARMGLPLVAAAVLPLFLLPGGSYPWLSGIVFVVAWLVFVVDLVVYQRRRVRYLATWLGRFDLGVVVLTAPWFLLFGPNESKFLLLIRLARIARLVMATRGARRLFERLGRVALVALVAVVLGSATAYRAEHATNPGFATFGDALWWGVVTLTTVGYGDIVPHTTTGRVAGVMIMVTGISVLGLLAGSMAGFFGLDSQPPPDTDADADADADIDAEPGSAGQTERAGPAGPGDGTALVREVVALQTQVARLADEVARLTSSGGPPADDLPPR